MLHVLPVVAFKTHQSMAEEAKCMLEGIVDKETAARLAAAQGPAAHPAGVGWLLEDVLVHTDERMGHVTAHKFLSTWRAAFANTTVTMQDLTDGNEFDWFAYLAGHRAGAVIFGGESGQTPPIRVVWFIIAKLAVLDEDVTMNDHRVNFCVFLEGGAMVMLHPTATGEEEAVVTMTPEAALLNGNITQLLGVGQPSLADAVAGAIDEGDRELALAEGPRIGMSECERVRLILNERARQWELARQKREPREKFTVNITSPEASTKYGIWWRVLFRGVAALRSMVADLTELDWEVLIVWLGCGHNRPALYVNARPYDEFVLLFTERGVRMRFLVDCIFWHL